MRRNATTLVSIIFIAELKVVFLFNVFLWLCCIENPEPFNSSELRNISLVNESIAANPSPNKYNIRIRKNRIVGGTSLQNKGPRKTSKVLYSTWRPFSHSYTSKVVKHVSRKKICSGVPPRGNIPNVTSIPEKGTTGYEITSDGPVKIVHPPVNKSVNPAEYYNPQGQTNFTTFKYKGNFWSLRTADRFRYKGEEGPSPAEYTVSQSPITKVQVNRNLLKMMTEAPQLRYLDIVQRKLCRENLSGPGQYSPKDPNTTKCHCGKNVTFGNSDIKDFCETQQGPGPAEYLGHGSLLHNPVSYVCAPFNVFADRFMESKEGLLPGPSTYKPQNDMWSDIQRKGHSKCSKWNAPFGSSAVRKISFINADIGCIPSPDYYYPQFQQKGDGNKSSGFASKSSRDQVTNKEDSPGPATYSVADSFKKVSSKKSHLHKTNASFLTSGDRLTPINKTLSPAPTTYNLPASTLRDKGCSFGTNPSHRGLNITPGPADYNVNPKYACSSIFNTYNVTLKSHKCFTKPIKMNTGPKRLVCFFQK